MRVLVAGASGAIGTRLVFQLIDRGHEVIGTFRSPGKDERLQAVGAKPIAVDLLDVRAVRKAVLETRPDAIVHQATALAGARFGRSLDRTFAPTNRLRTEGTDALLAAAQDAGVRRFVAQSFASYRYAREGGPVKTEDDRLDPSPPASTRETNAAMSPQASGNQMAGGAIQSPSAGGARLGSRTPPPSSSRAGLPHARRDPPATAGRGRLKWKRSLGSRPEARRSSHSQYSDLLLEGRPRPQQPY